MDSFDADGERPVSRAEAVWFRNGGYARQVDFTRERRHQSKIYTESNQSGFSQIFSDLTSMQTLALYRRLLIRG
jgi:hypothetical protein